MSLEARSSEKNNFLKFGLVIFIIFCILFSSLPAFARRVKKDTAVNFLDIRPVQTEEERWQLWEFAIKCGAPIVMGRLGNEIEGFVMARDSKTEELLGGFYYVFNPPPRGNCAKVYWNIFVHPERRFEGVGRELFENFIGHMKEYGLDGIYFYAIKEVVPFLQKMGAEFVSFNIFKGYRMYYEI
ncbi:MAG: GNAT family N-acetyltransferase [Candidatus Omnitrophica bacterium]|nr:GNAT family N-acetyltransferase [Candidatus Omnitrophota bacterium]